MANGTGNRPDEGRASRAGLGVVAVEKETVGARSAPCESPRPFGLPGRRGGEVGLGVLTEAMQRLSASATREEAAAILKGAARQVAGADGAFVVLRGDRRCHCTEETVARPPCDGECGSVTTCLLGWATLRTEVTVSSDVRSDAAIPTGLRRSPSVVALAMVPIAGGPSVGAVGVHWSDHRSPSPAVMSALDLLGRAAGMALHSLDLTASLRESEARVRSLFEDNHAVLLLVDPDDGSIVDANASAACFYGWTRSQMRRKRIWDINTLPPDQISAEMARARGGERRNFSFRHQMADGSFREVEVSSGPILLAGRQLLYSLVHDVTDRARAEEAVKQSESRLRALADALPQLVWSATGDGRTDFFNRRQEAYDGFLREPDGAWDWRPVIHPAETEATLAAWTEAIRTGHPYEMECRLRGADGTYRWHLSRARPLCNDWGEVVRWYGSSTDIHDLKTAENALRDSEERLRLALDAAALADFEVDFDSGTASGSPRLREIFGFEPNVSFTLDDMRDRYHPEDRDRVIDATRRIHAGLGNRFETEIRVVRPDGTEVWVEVLASTVFNEDGSPKRGIGVMRDITERKEVEDRHRVLMREVDHRARNALAVVQAVVRLTTAETKEAFVEAVQGRVEALARTHSLLARNQWSGAELRTLVSEELAPYIGRRKDRVYLSGPAFGVVPEAVQSMGMVVHELATNAAKYGALSVPEGTIDVAWERLLGGDLRFVWQEDGGPETHEPAHPGFGSTVIAGTVVNQLGGTIDLYWRSDGLRCEFTIPASRVLRRERPYGRCAANTVASARVGSVAGCRVLVVEDDVLIAAAVDRLLREMGCVPIGPAATLEEALRLAAAEDRPDVAVVGANLQGREALPVAEALRARGVPFVLAAGYGDAMPSYADAPVLEKPFVPAQLASVLWLLLHPDRVG